MPTVFDNPSADNLADGPKFIQALFTEMPTFNTYALTLAWSTRTPTPMVLDTDRRLK
jgi:hypothetical protein